MPFYESGQHPVRIKEACGAAPRFNTSDPTAFDIALLVETLDGRQSDWWHGEISKAYGRGNLADKMQYEITLATLEKIGWTHGTHFSDENLKTLEGVETVASVVENKGRDGDKSFYNVKYIGPPPNQAPEKINSADLAAKAAAMFGNGDRNQQSQPAQQTQPERSPYGAGGNPFA